MSVIQLVDMKTGHTLVSYYMTSDDPTDDALDAMETVVEAALMKDSEVGNWCRHMLAGGCDVCDR